MTFRYFFWNEILFQKKNHNVKRSCHLYLKMFPYIWFVYFPAKWKEKKSTNLKFESHGRWLWSVSVMSFLSYPFVCYESSTWGLSSDQRSVQQTYNSRGGQNFSFADYWALICVRGPNLILRFLSKAVNVSSEGRICSSLLYYDTFKQVGPLTPHLICTDTPSIYLAKLI